MTILRYGTSAEAAARVPDTAPTMAPGTTQGESPAPAAETAQAAPLTEKIALLDHVLAARAATSRASLRATATAIPAA